MSRHLKLGKGALTPLIYPDYCFSYDVKVKDAGEKVIVTVDLDQPIPQEYLGKICFNLELFPGSLFGKPWIMDNKQGIFPRQANGPVQAMPLNFEHSGGLPAEGAASDIAWLTNNRREYTPMLADDIIGMPYAVGRVFTMCPDDPASRSGTAERAVPHEVT